VYCEGVYPRSGDPDNGFGTGIDPKPYFPLLPVAQPPLEEGVIGGGSGVDVRNGFGLGVMECSVHLGFERLFL